MNQITYILYILLSTLIVVLVGNWCYKNGKVYILNYFSKDVSFGNGINKLLRTAYYLLNIGLAIWSLHSMREINTSIEVILEICNRLSYILLIIASLHFINIYAVYLIYKHYNNNKNENQHRTKLAKN
ncbi:hypothetical protein [Polaribacter aquimarinus]|uniref:Uncharacterized protein n=1 Tax=Polaribacter aquimarinus TaxID=2100726 RepID=A0A2U2J769_9FLAO|nr:hypothetical protein [Polaribacter aquimarinus]PWG04178.1 hypothetical protein DIS07_14540 [Polaribacter aquimarinus]